MINEDIIIYIQAQIRKDTPRDTIVYRLSNAGWHIDDIDKAFLKLTPPVPHISKTAPTFVFTLEPLKEQSEMKPDLYREPTIDKPEAIASKPFLAPLPQIEKEPVASPIFSSSFSEANTKNATPSYYIPDNTTYNKNEVKEEKSEPSLNFGVMRPKVIQVSSVEKETSIPTLIKTEVYNEELIPKLISKVYPPTPTIKPAETLPTFKEPPTTTPLVNQNKVLASKFIPTSAILHSYPQILLSSKEVNNNLFTPQKSKKKKIITWVVIMLGVSFIAGAVFALVYKNSNFSFVKKDPKSLLLGAPAVLSALNSYKIETNVNISTPSFTNITNGLVSGEAISSRERDSFSLNAKGSINNNGQQLPNFDYQATFKSSLFKDNIVSNIKHINTSTFISIPDLSNLFGKNAPAQNTILINKGQFNTITNLLPDSVSSKIDKVNFDKFLSTILPSYVTNETTSVFKEFISRASVVEKAQDSVNGVATYHYALSADSQTTKKFLSQFAIIFLSDLSSDQKNMLDETLGAVTFDTFEVWIGKDDGNIHQYKFVLNAPLSKIIGLNDKGIAGNIVSLDWKTTYYDFNVANTIESPQSSISATDFIKNVDDMKIKDLVSLFKTLADSMYNATGNFGKRSNPTGSCVNPNPSSLFSPVGHPKGASNAVGNIASLINNILSATNSELSCYSDSKAWAISAPLASDMPSSYCSDSAGNMKILDTQLTGVICQ